MSGLQQHRQYSSNWEKLLLALCIKVMPFKQNEAGHQQWQLDPGPSHYENECQHVCYKYYVVFDSFKGSSSLG